MSEVIVMPHRGGCNEAIENSWVALDYASSLGYKYFETDIRATKDNVIVIYHDDNLKRVNDRVGVIKDMTWDELSEISYSDGSPIVRLEDALKKVFRFTFIIDIKDNHVLEPLIELLQRNPQFQERVILASFSSSRLKKVRKVFLGNVKTSMGLTEVLRMKIASTLTISPRLLGVPTCDEGVVAVQVPTKASFITVVTKRFVSTCHKRGFAVQVWVVDDPDEMERLLDLGVDGIFTDSPTIAKQILIKRGAVGK